MNNRIQGIIIGLAIATAFVAGATLGGPRDAEAQTPASVTCTSFAHTGQATSWMQTQLSRGRTNFVGVQDGMCAW